MDNAQLLKGVLEGCVLAVISEGETYGYQIISELEAAGFEDIGEGTLYPVLTRLDKNKMIQCRRAKSPLGPVRKYYSITPRGEEALSDLKARYKKITRSAEKLLYGEFDDKTEE
ncbi:PadR family transcriptional regulator [Ruminococcus sp.]|uniref:PadR family transcriptional regulator n=1 Tax=Ruminococcus sp. TaxID=41978 RepID=UPI0025DCA863|nr:PadR family transcriptional regulator [Ruminococcus sp.]MBQ8965185.1 PadR family transcriptional regulator [Ruminococcus sp.]